MSTKIKKIVYFSPHSNFNIPFNIPWLFIWAQWPNPAYNAFSINGEEKKT
jgi:hypothetical protein